MAIRAVIFDLDGVIVSTDAMHYRAWKSIADSEGIYFDEYINNRLRGVSRMESLEIILERATREYSDAEKRGLAETKNARYVELLEGLTPGDVPEEVATVLETLKANGVKIAVGSSSRNTPLILKRIGMERAFDAVADGNDIERSKPAPDVFLVAARRLGVEPGECVAVEDAEAGVRAAKAAGMIAAAMGDAVRSSEADYRLGGIGDVLGLLSGEGIADSRRTDHEGAKHMPSPEAQRFIGLLKANGAQMGAAASIEEMRRGMEAMVAAMHPAPSFATYTPLDFDNIHTELTSVGRTGPGKTVMYLHGGAFKMGSAAQDRHLTAEIAKRTGANVVAVDYRLSPENKFPAALEDSLAAYRGLLATGYEASDIVFVGVSAGATLALATTLALKDQDLPLPGAVVAVSAATYLDSAEGTHTTNREKDVVLGSEDVPAGLVAVYAPDEDPRNPYISPLYGDYVGLPPMLLVVGTDETVYDDSVLLAEKGRASGVEVDLITGEGMPHAYPVFADAFPEAEAALDDICKYVRRQLAE